MGRFDFSGNGGNEPPWFFAFGGITLHAEDTELCSLLVSSRPQSGGPRTLR